MIESVKNKSIVNLMLAPLISFLGYGVTVGHVDTKANAGYERNLGRENIQEGQLTFEKTYFSSNIH